MDLQEHLDHEIAKADDTRQEFVVDDDSKANWAIRKIAEHRADFNQKRDIAVNEIHRVEQWLAMEQKRIEDRIAYLEGLLQQYHTPLYTADSKRYKTISLPNGKMQWRKVQPIFVRETDKLVAWLQAQNKHSYIETKLAPKWADLKPTLAVAGETAVDPDTGEVVDGIKVLPGGEQFRVITKDMTE